MTAERSGTAIMTPLLLDSLKLLLFRTCSEESKYWLTEFKRQETAAAAGLWSRFEDVTEAGV
jgi:hypothetical protein